MSGAPTLIHVTDKPLQGGGIARVIERYTSIAQSAGLTVKRVRLANDASEPGAIGFKYSAAQTPHPESDALKSACHGADLIHLHLGATALSPAAIKALAATAPLIVSLHDVSPFDPNGLRIPKGEAKNASGFETVKNALRTRVFAKAHKSNGLAIGENAAAILAPSQFLMAKAEDMGWPRLRLLPHGVDFPTQAIPEPPDTPPRYLYAGRLSEEKGALLALNALKFLPKDTELVMCGDGPMRADLEARAQKLKAKDRVRFLGWQAPEALQEQIAAAHVVVQPSLVPEGFGLAIVEAAAMGRACVTLGRGAHGELGGPIAEKATPKSVASALEPYLTDPALAHEDGHRAFMRAKALCDPKDQARALLEIYASVLAPASKVPA